MIATQVPPALSLRAGLNGPSRMLPLERSSAFDADDFGLIREVDREVRDRRQTYSPESEAAEVRFSSRSGSTQELGDPRSPGVPDEWIEADLDWLDEYGADPLPTGTRSDLPPVEVDGRLTPVERAFRAAEALAGSFGWNRGEREILCRILERSAHSQTHAAIQRLMEQGATSEELELADQLRELWLEHPEFHGGLERPGGARGLRPSPTLGWALAVDVVRAFAAYPDPEEIVYKLEELHDHWSRTLNLCHEFPTFARFLRDLTRDGGDGCLESEIVLADFGDVQDDWERVSRIKVQRELDRLNWGPWLS